MLIIRRRYFCSNLHQCAVITNTIDLFIQSVSVSKMEFQSTRLPKLCKSKWRTEKSHSKLKLQLLKIFKSYHMWSNMLCTRVFYSKMASISNFTQLITSKDMMSRHQRSLRLLKMLGHFLNRWLPQFQTLPNGLDITRRWTDSALKFHALSNRLLAKHTSSVCLMAWSRILISVKVELNCG